MRNENTFRAICRALERMSAPRGTVADWLRAVGDQREEALRHFAVFQRGYLQREADAASDLYCPRCLCRHEVFVWSEEKLAVLRRELYPTTDPALSEPPSTLDFGPGTLDSPVITASCRCDDHPGCPDMHLTAADIEVWVFSWTRFARALCGAFGCNSQFADLKIRDAYQIGSWSVEALPIILTIQPDSARLRAAILELIARWRQRFILLGPTADSLDAPCLELLERNGSAFFALESNLVFADNGMLQPVKTPGQLFAQFTPEPKESDQSLLQRAFALVKALDADCKPPLPLTIFRLYCIDNLTMDQVMRRCKCSKGTVVNRLDFIRAKTGLNVEHLRQMSGQFERMGDALHDDRASHIHRKNLIDEPDAE